jgi:hypothetical protein
MMDQPISDGGAVPALRASDAERERTAAALRRHHLDGRLDTDELQDRLGRCYSARTQAELAALTADLPGERPPGGARPGRGSTRARRPAVPLVGVLLVAVAIAATLGAAVHGHPGPLPFLVLFVLLRAGLGPRRRWSGGARHPIG